MDIYEFVAHRIKELRTRNGASQAELAQAIGVATNTVSRWETQANKPTIKDIEAVSRFFRVSVTFFFPGAEELERSEVRQIGELVQGLNVRELRDVQKYVEFVRVKSSHPNS